MPSSTLLSHVTFNPKACERPYVFLALSFWCLLLWPCGVTATFRQTDRLQLNVSSLLPPRTQASDRLSTSEANPEQEVCGRRKGDVWNENNSCLETLNIKLFLLSSCCVFFFFILINCCSEKRLCSFLYWIGAVGDLLSPMNRPYTQEPHEQTLQQLRWGPQAFRRDKSMAVRGCPILPIIR